MFLKHNLIDVLLISETHCTNRTYCHIPLYKIYYTNHPDGTAHAGTAIIIRQTISHHELPGFRKQFLQATTIKVSLLPYEITLASVYCTPRHNIKEQQFAEFFRTLGYKFLAGGDYNIKNTLWGSRITTTKGRELPKVMENNKSSFITTATPTYLPTDQRKTPDLLDFFITCGISESYLDITASYDLSSDHTPIIATVSEFIINKQPIPKLHNRKTDWVAYKEAIQHGINLHISLKSPHEIEHTITVHHNSTRGSKTSHSSD